MSTSNSLEAATRIGPPTRPPTPPHDQGPMGVADSRQATQLTLADAVPLATALSAHVARRVGVRVLFIKGPVAELQGLRAPHESLDVDLLVEPGGAMRFVDGLRGLGWHDRRGYRPLPLSGGHATTLIHDEWPCDIDVHFYWPGFAASTDEVFETLWERRAEVPIAGHPVDAPSRTDGMLVLALHALRGARTPNGTRAYRQLVGRAHTALDERERTMVRDAAQQLGAAATAAPFLRELGFATPADADSEEAVLWRIRSDVSGGTADWLIELRRTSWWRRPKVLVEAVFPSPSRLRMLHPEVGPRRSDVVVAWWRRLRTGIAALPEARRATAALRREARDDATTSGRARRR
jgi:hypothetical protein